MADLFNFEKVEEGADKGQGKGKYIYPGIYHNVLIKNVKKGSSPNGTPFIEIEMYTKEGGPEAAKSFKFYTSEKAKPKSLEKIKHIATKVAKEDDVNKAKDLEALRDLLKGNALRMKFTGREYLNSSNERKEVAEIGLPPFAEAIQEGAEYPVVEDENTELKFDKNNEWDFKKLDEGEESPDDDKSSGDGVAWA